MNEGELTSQEKQKVGESFVELVSIMSRLRSETGCPWDRKQTHESLKRYLLEESCELFDAIDSGEPDAVCEELGDLFLQGVFHAQIAREAGQFDVADTLQAICAKLLHRHPHVFGEEHATNPDEVMTIWQRQKKAEKSGQKKESILSGVPTHLPSLARSQELTRKASRVGFDWPEAAGALEKVFEEIEELKEVVENGADRASREEEVGDLFFAIGNICRFLEVEAEEALRKANRKFERRFQQIEQKAAALGRDLSEMTLKEMDALWDKVKAEERDSADP